MERPVIFAPYPSNLSFNQCLWNQESLKQRLVLTIGIDFIQRVVAYYDDPHNNTLQHIFEDAVCVETEGAYFAYLNVGAREKLTRMWKEVRVDARLVMSWFPPESALDFVVSCIVANTEHWKGGWRKIDHINVEGTCIIFSLSGYTTTWGQQPKWTPPPQQQQQQRSDEKKGIPFMQFPPSVMFELALHSHQLHAQFMRHDAYRVHVLGLDTLTNATKTRANVQYTEPIRQVQKMSTHEWRKEQKTFPAPMHADSQSYWVFRCPLSNKRDVATFDYYQMHHDAYKESNEMQQYDSRCLVTAIYQQGVFAVFVLQRPQKKEQRLFCKMYYDNDDCTWLAVPNQPLVENLTTSTQITISAKNVAMKTLRFFDFTSECKVTADFPPPLSISYTQWHGRTRISEIDFACKVDDVNGRRCYALVVFFLHENVFSFNVHYNGEFVVASETFEKAGHVLSQLQAWQKHDTFLSAFERAHFVPMPDEARLCTPPYDHK